MNSDNKKYISITNLYRNILLDFLKTHNNCCEYEATIDNLLFSKNFDNIFIKKNNKIIKDINDLKTFKFVIMKLIVADNYSYINVFNCDNQENEHINDLYKMIGKNNVFSNEIVDELNNYEYNLDIIDFINDCIDNKKICLPSDPDLRELMYSNFIDYNVYNMDKTYDYELLNKYGYTKTLKKINPCYFLDCFSGE